jgi:hypothetical protein
MIERNVLVLNDATWMDTGEPVEPVHNQQGGSPLPDFVLNYQPGQPAKIVADLGESVPCRCPVGSPLPDLTLNYATAVDGGTLTSIVANDGIHSFDTTIAGGSPVKIGGRHGTDAQYDDGPAIRQAAPEEMSDEDKRRIGLPLADTVLVFKRDARGQTTSNIASL